jgi:plasmid maintenance system antidote protein VapI
MKLYSVLMKSGVPNGRGVVYSKETIIEAAAKNGWIIVNCSDGEIEAHVRIEDGGDFKPDWASPPGDSILDWLEHKGMTEEDFAKELYLTKEFVDRLLVGDERITWILAEQLSTLFGISSSFWVRREEQYRNALERLKKNG